MHVHVFYLAAADALAPELSIAALFANLLLEEVIKGTVSGGVAGSFP